MRPSRAISESVGRRRLLFFHCRYARTTTVIQRSSIGALAVRGDRQSSRTASLRDRSSGCFTGSPARRLTLPDGDANYATRWRLIKEIFTRAYCKRIGVPTRTKTARARGEQPVWQRRFWEHLIRDERDLAAHIDYIHHNPVRHGLVSAPRDWQHSTFSQWVDRGVYDPTWGSGEMPELPEWAKRHE